MQKKNQMVMEHVDDDETLLAVIYKHPFGIVSVYVMSFIGIMMAIGLLGFLLPAVSPDNTSISLIVSGFAAVATVFAVLILLIATIIYRQNRMIITDKNITQILQTGLFNRKVSQLTMANVEDVTSEQVGIFSSIFNYGVLKIETAGEQMNFHFNYCPRSSYYAKVILEAREQFISSDNTNNNNNLRR